MTLLADMGGRIAAAFAPLAGDLTIKVTTTIQAKAAAPAAAGATSLQLSTTATLLAGDTFAAGGPATRVIAADAAPAAGVAVVSFSPATTASIAGGSGVPVTRSASYPCKGWEEGVDLRSSPELVKRDDRVFVVLAAGLPIIPAPGNVIVAADGTTLHVASAALDGFGAAWRIIARRS